MKTYTYKESVTRLNTLLKRDEGENLEIRQQVLSIIEDVKARGDEALKDYTQRFDGCALDTLAVTPEEIEAAYAAVDPEMIAIMEEAAANIRAFHEKQLETTWTYNPGPGITLGQHITAIERVGLYVPGGKAAYPSTVLMDSIPALVAGVDSLVMVTPPGRDGKINPNILAVIAGPSEVLILADGDANPVFAAADLLSQAEHDEMAMPILVTTSPDFGAAVETEVYRQIEADLGRKAIAKKSVDDYGYIFVCDTLDEAFALSNAIAPEHMEILLPQAQDYLERVRNAGAIFLGSYTPEPLGDYFAGPNHTLPTSGTAKFSSPLGVYDFTKRSSILSYSADALEKSYKKIAAFARSEGLDAHAKSVERRFES